ncbi:hypothetical protein PHLGIDRAFT_18677 [Phlebiopsis gigantea 11061_1 CR5-6]|uniref:RlpA-like protein double-psi beta-barrel domain-containing protein n=1 Tax=Phlebiopsis gigantea (strain 11061_1 CR5-6) TaxID=745531 RepID=A0A0C3SD18_PHLG1|nr:hypothetical protein PHLGIDRAFT_18677 [Phlebiopsis gigantea 11061_1 CR5-6]
MLALANFTFLSTLVLSLSLSSFVLADSHESSRRRHAGTNFLSTNHALSKRFDNARFSYYETGEGACGAFNKDSDFIVALNSAQYDGGSHCFATITITANGKTTQAQITDECPGCPYGGLDLSPGLFSYFASEDAGIIYGSWDFGSGSKPSPTPTPTPTSTWSPPPPPPTSTWSPPPLPTSTWSPPPTTSSTPPPPSTTSERKTSTTSSYSSFSSFSSFSSSTPSSSSSATPTSSSTSATPTPTPISNLAAMNQALLALTGLVIAAGQGQ